MSINASDLRQLVIRPTLRHIGLWSESAENLLMGTAAQETLLGRYLKQINGVALGLFQMEPATHEDLYDNYLFYHADLEDVIHGLLAPRVRMLDQLVWNLAYATACCRIQYYRFPEPLPAAHDIDGLAMYWKTRWNTVEGKGTVEEFVKNYTALVVG